MNPFLALADDIPIIMATAAVIAATLVMSMVGVAVRLLQPTPWAFKIALIIAPGAWAMVYQTL